MMVQDARILFDTIICARALRSWRMRAVTRVRNHQVTKCVFPERYYILVVASTKETPGPRNFDSVC